jgi:hypothetical protein
MWEPVSGNAFYPELRQVSGEGVHSLHHQGVLKNASARKAFCHSRNSCSSRRCPPLARLGEGWLCVHYRAWKHSRTRRTCCASCGVLGILCWSDFRRLCCHLLLVPYTFFALPERASEPASFLDQQSRGVCILVRSCCPNLVQRPIRENALDYSTDYCGPFIPFLLDCTDSFCRRIVLECYSRKEIGAGNLVLWRFDAQASSPPVKSDYRNVAVGRFTGRIPTFRESRFSGLGLRVRCYCGLRWIHFFPVGTFCLNSSNQFSTTLICVGAACACSLGLSIRNRWPSGDTS